MDLVVGIRVSGGFLGFIRCGYVNSEAQKPKNGGLSSSLTPWGWDSTAVARDDDQDISLVHA